MKRGREGRHRPWIFFLVFIRSSSMLVRWSSLHRFESGVRLPFRSSPQNGDYNFRLSLYFRGWCSTRFFTSWRPAANLTHFQKRVVLFTSAWYRREGIYVFGGSTPAQKIREYRFFSHFLLPLSFTRNWLTYNQCFGLTHRRSSIFFFLLFFLLSLLPQS